MRRRFGRVTVAIVGLVTLSGVAVSAGVDAPLAGAASASKPRLTLLDRGSSPRSPLRLTLTAGAVTQATLQFTESIEQTLDGESANSISTPPIDLVISATIHEVGPKGDAEVSYTYDSVTVVDDGTLSTEERANIESSLAPLITVTSTATVTARNESKDASVENAAALGDTTAQFTEQLADQLGSLSVVFPVEPVGLGARWREASSVTLGTLDVHQRSDYTLRERDGTRVLVDVAYVQTAPRQRAKLPGVPSGAKVDMTKYRITGKGTITIDLANVLPFEGTLRAAGTQTFHLRVEGEEGTLSQDVAFDVSLTRPPAPA